MTERWAMEEAKEAHKKAQCKQEAEEHAKQRGLAPAATGVPEGGWCARAQVHLQSMAVAAASPIAATSLPKIGDASGGWCEHMTAKEKQAAVGASSPTTPIISLPPESKKDADGFEMVPNYLNPMQCDTVNIGSGMDNITI